MRRKMIVAFTVITLLCLGAAGANAPAGSPEATLVSKGLIKSGSLWLVKGDVQLRECLRTMRQAKRKLDESISRRIEIERQIRAADQVFDQLAAQDENLSNQMEKSKGVPFRYNQLVGQVNAVRAREHEAQRFQEDRKADLAKIVDPRDDYVVAVLDLSNKMEATDRQYQALAADPDVKAAIDRLNEKAGPKSRLGPSDAFAHELPGVRRERENVNTAAIKFNNDTHTPQVDVTLNGKLTISMILDSGASYVSLGWEVARQLGITPAPGDRVVKTIIANGQTANAYVKVLDTVRLGPFTAENVVCIVAPKSEKNSPNLLGGSFLEHFVYKMDLAAGEVRLSQISGKNDPRELRAGPLAATPGTAGGAGSPGSAKEPPVPMPGGSPAAKEKPSAPGGADGKWLVLFRSSRPSDWDAAVNEPDAFSVPLDQAPAAMAYLRLRNADGDFVIIPLSREELRKRVVRENSGWEGRDIERSSARHLGIFVKSMPRRTPGSIDVTQGSRSGWTGYGFGNRVGKDDRQGYAWAGKPVEVGAIEIAVTSKSLTQAEKEKLVSE
jgi:clan AA aspartic protease (TIGR02281 family)